MMIHYKITAWKDKKLLISAIVFLIMVMGWIFYALFGHQLVEAMYEGRSVGFLNRIIAERVTHHPVEYYFEQADTLFLLSNIYIILILACFSLVISNVHINLAISILSFMGVALVFICTSGYGVGVSSDSTVYISVARNLLSGHGYLGWWGGPLTVYAPLFPTILAILGLAGIDPLGGARFFNAVVFGLIIFTSGQLFRMSVRSKKLVILGVISILMSTTFLGISVMALSDPLFILLTILSIIFLQKFLIEKRWLFLLLFSVIVAFACVERYAGIALVLTGFFSILFLLQGVSFLQKLKYGITFCVISITPFLFWIVRNYILTQTFFGPRFPSQASLLETIFYSFYILAPWMVPDNIPFELIAISAGTILIMTAIVFFFYKKYKGIDTNVLIKILPAGVFVLIYIQILINSVPNIAVEINDRFLSVAYFCILFFILVSIDIISNLINQSRRNVKWMNSIITVLFVLWLLHSSVGSLIATSGWIRSGGSGLLNSALWRNSSLIEWLQINPLDGAIYSNAPDAIYIHIEKKDELNFRRYRYMLPKGKGDDLRQLKELLKSNNRTYLVWFKYADREFLYNIQDLRSVFVLKEVAVLPDGTVYLFKQ